MIFPRYINIGKAKKIHKNGKSGDNGVLKYIEKAKSGDIKAYEKIYEMFIDRIYRYVYYQVKDEMITDDITQEVFTAAWEAISRYEYRGQPFSSWLYRIAYNQTMDFFRVSRRRPGLNKEVRDEIKEPEKILEEKLMQEELSQAISQLNPQQRQIITLKFIEGLRNDDIAQITGKSQGAIRVAQMRALTALRRRLNGNGGSNK